MSTEEADLHRLCILRLPTRRLPRAGVPVRCLRLLGAGQAQAAQPKLRRVACWILHSPSSLKGSHAYAQLQSNGTACF